MGACRVDIRGDKEPEGFSEELLRDLVDRVAGGLGAADVKVLSALSDSTSSSSCSSCCD